MSTAATRRYSLEEYFDREDKSPLRHEYYDGGIFTVGGHTEVHCLITTGTAVTLWNTLADRDDHYVYPSRMRVTCSSGLYTYPDTAVVRGVSDLLKRPDDHTLRNPVLIAEVLSPDSEAYDRGDKFEHYKTIPTLQSYLLVTQYEPRVEHFARQADDQWKHTEISGLDAEISLPELEITFSLASLYAQVEFPPPDEPAESSGQTPPIEPHPSGPKQ